MKNRSVDIEFEVGKLFGFVDLVVVDSGVF